MSIQKIVVSAILKNYVKGLDAWFKSQPYFNASVENQNTANLNSAQGLHFTPSDKTPVMSTTPTPDVTTEPKKTGTSLTSGGG